MRTEDKAVLPAIVHRAASIGRLSIAYREAGDPKSPKTVMLHGWPVCSPEYRTMIQALAGRFHVISPDYPGFGNSDMPDPAKFAYTFDQLSQITENFLKANGFDRYGLFVRDYGGSQISRVARSSVHELWGNKRRIGPDRGRNAKEEAPKRED